MTKRAPVNTTEQVRRKPMATLVESMVLGPSATIQNQEKDGQRSFVNSETLPTDMGHGYDTKSILEAAGVKFLGQVKGDDMFQYVELPKGWSKKPTDHSMWSKLVDDKGRTRASIFYKAAFYDRSAHMSLERRFDVGLDYERLHKDGMAVVKVTDGGTVLYSTDPVKMPERSAPNYSQIEEEAVKAATAWLEQKYPDWRSPSAYWD